MKKFLLFALSVFMMSTSAFAWKLVTFTVSVCGDDYTPIGNGGPRDLINPPTVYIEDYVLMFEANHPDYVLNIKDATGAVVFTTFVCSAMTLAPLPYTLSGDYEVELFYSYWLFTGYINL